MSPQTENTLSTYACDAGAATRSSHQPASACLLNLHLILHPHTGLMLADKITSSLTQWEIDESKRLMAVTDNGLI